jgi:sugar lactone lactonase YvrE
MLHLDARPAPVCPARHGQGPVWDGGAGELLWMNRAGEIRWGRVDPAGGVRDLAVRQAGEPVAALAPLDRGLTAGGRREAAGSLPTGSWSR